MRKLLLAALVLSATYATANSIDFNTGMFQSGTMAGSFSSALSIGITGSEGTVIVKTGMLTKVACPSSGETCYNFSSGSAAVVKHGGLVFLDSLSGGIVINDHGAASMDATLDPEHGVASGQVVTTWAFGPGNIVTTGSANVVVLSTVAEPQSYGLMGLGVLGLIAGSFAGSFKKRRQLNR